MTELEHHHHPHEAMDTTSSLAQRPPSPASTPAMNFAASFHRDAQQCRTASDRELLHQAYRDKILSIDHLAASVAAALKPLLNTSSASRKGPDSERWADFDRLAQRGKNLRDRESQHLQHQSGIIAAWGLERFQHYGWHALPLPLLRQLHELAVLVPRWEDTVDVLNSYMLARHKLRIVGGKNTALRVGEHSSASKVQDPSSPVERCDILAALGWAREKATSTTALHQVKTTSRDINGSPIKQFGLKRDLYGMVIPYDSDKDSHAVDIDDDLSPRVTKRTKRSQDGTVSSSGVFHWRTQYLQKNATKSPTVNLPDRRMLEDGTADIDLCHNDEQLSKASITSAALSAAASPHESSDPALDHELGSEPSAWFQDLQARNAERIEQLIQELDQPHESPDVTMQRKLQLEWLRPEQWASIYAEPMHLLGKSPSISAKDADVWYLGWEAFRDYATRGHVFRQPVVIKQHFQDSGMYDIAEYLDMLWQRFPQQQIDVQDSMTGASASMTLKEYCLTVAEANTAPSGAIAPVSNAANLRRLARADEPLLSRLPRFQLLSTLVDRAIGLVGNSALSLNYTEDCLAFNTLSFAGAFTRPHVAGAFGTWIRCVSGSNIWAIANNLDADDWQRFAIEGHNWSPQGKGRLVVLEEDDVLFIPPGLNAVQACFTTEPCLMEGGLYLDECAIPQMLESLMWTVKNQVPCYKPIPVQADTVVSALEQWLNDDNCYCSSLSKAEDAQYRQAVRAGIVSWRNLQQQLSSQLPNW